MILEKIYPIGDETIVLYDEGKVFIQFDGCEYVTESKSYKDITLKRTNGAWSHAGTWSLLFWKLDDRNWHISTATSFIPFSHIQKCYSKIDEISEYIKGRK
jgi:hypothetical protein